MEKLKELRGLTGAGMVDCKKALDETSGDIEKAVELLRKKGIAKAAKRGNRETSEGIVLVDTNADNTEGYIIEFNSETDFVSRNEKFLDLTKAIMDLAKQECPADLEALMSLLLDGITVKDTVDNLSGVIGEKLAVANYEILKTTGTVVAYSHLGGRIGVLVELDKAGISEMGIDIAMQVAATDPKFINPEDVDKALISKEREVYKEQLLKEGKPENIIDNILEGKIKKLYTEICLAKQEFIKDDKQSVEGFLGGAKVVKFVRYSL